ncbi:MAG: hypothetical protein ACKVOH_06330 [Chlamydiales bacterium]
MIQYDEEIGRLFHNGCDLTQCGKYHFNFTEKGYFALLNSKGEPFYEQVIPLAEKVLSHSIWITLWMLFILATNFWLPDSWLFILNKIAMAMILLHFFILGCRATTLLISGGVSPLFFPPLWTKLTRKFLQGSGIELLAKHQLEEHPGLLVNLALAQHLRGEEKNAEQNLQKAFSLCSTHPILQQFAKREI